MADERNHEESHQELLARIVADPRIFGGKPIIRGHRMSVGTLLFFLSSGSTVEELLDEYEWLEADDIRACLLYASGLANAERFEPVLVDGSK